MASVWVKFTETDDLEFEGIGYRNLENGKEAVESSFPRAKDSGKWTQITPHLYKYCCDDGQVFLKYVRIVDS